MLSLAVNLTICSETLNKSYSTSRLPSFHVVGLIPTNIRSVLRHTLDLLLKYDALHNAAALLHTTDTAVWWHHILIEILHILITVRTFVQCPFTIKFSLH